MNLIYRQKIRKVNKIKYIIKGSKRSEIKDYISGKLIRDFELYIEYKIKNFWGNSRSKESSLRKEQGEHEKLNS